MLNDGWKCYVEFNPGMITNSVFLVRRKEFGVREFLLPDNTIKTVKEGERIEDSLVFAQLDDDMIAALMQGFDKHGVKPPEQSYTEGKLQATERHLEDMRMIVGHVKKIPLERKTI